MAGLILPNWLAEFLLLRSTGAADCHGFPRRYRQECCQRQQKDLAALAAWQAQPARAAAPPRARGIDPLP